MVSTEAIDEPDAAVDGTLASERHLVCEVSRHVAEANGRVRSDADWEATVAETSAKVKAVSDGRPFEVVSNDRRAEFFVATEADRRYVVGRLLARMGM